MRLASDLCMGLFKQASFVRLILIFCYDYYHVEGCKKKGSPDMKILNESIREGRSDEA